ncbi:unnamed protein product [Phytomonas sp. EM1]|nr:unnamed protein product [Phytomonas sp. EM1]|eukprot:CCW65343.1 unnamed protein product [Phytomonas sp. isolate EM1]
MLACSACRLSRIPDVGHQSKATFRWATYSFWYVIDPLLRRHFQYYQRKVQLDRWLEKNNFFTNCIIGVLLGMTVYFVTIKNFLPSSEDIKRTTMEENIEEILSFMNLDTKTSFPAFQMMRAKREIIGKMHEAMDHAEVQKQKDEVERMKLLARNLQPQKG